MPERRGPRPKPTGRRSISVPAITAAIARQEEEDAATPIEPVTSLMGAIRAFAPLIMMRRKRGFSDPQIVAMLKHHGVEISVETLRVYRGRLKREAEEAGESPRLHDEHAARASVPAASTHHEQAMRVGGAKPTDMVSRTGDQDPQAPAPAPSPARGSANPRPRGSPEQPGFNRKVSLDDGV